jgi:hypothetical protein
VAQQEDLNSHVGVVRPLESEESEGPDEGEVEEREGHGPFVAVTSVAGELPGQRTGSGFWHPHQQDLIPAGLPADGG